jgi:hypothetical protein
MINTTIKTALTQGLLAGYAGETECKKITRGGFELLQSHFEKDGIIYHDEWLPARTGGGQELVEIDGNKYARFYAGGVVDDSQLNNLGISASDVITTLINKIKQLGSATRLDEDCIPESESAWQYQYVVENVQPEFGLLTAKETLSYKQAVVFIHYFILVQVIT